MLMWSSSRFLAFGKHLPNHRYRCEHVGPPGIERQLRQRFGGFSLSQAVVHRAIEVRTELGYLSGGYQRTVGDQATVTRSKAGA
ncbi:hypothetical protein D3C80_1527430 [compost metagenome]